MPHVLKQKHALYATLQAAFVTLMLTLAIEYVLFVKKIITMH